MRIHPPRVLALAMIGIFFVAGPSLAQKERLGWHGETMPDGLERTDEDGEYIWEKDGSIMVWVPSGEFLMGNADGPKDEQPARTVWLDGFYIDKYEITWKQWKMTGLDYSKDPHHRIPMPRAPDWGIVDNQPALNISWNDAQEYVEWAGKRLPTEAEWEKAARGTDGRKYPWGNEPPTYERAVWRDHPTAKGMVEIATCCKDGASPYGAVNMAGNVYEWCEDVYAKDYYSRAPQRNPVNREEGKFRVLRGGSFVLEVEDLSSTLRYRLLPYDRGPYIGFRAALSGAAETGE